MYLLDTNVLSELRRGPKCHRKVRAWAKANVGKEHFISVLSLGEIRRGIESLRRKAPDQSKVFEQWLDKLLVHYEEAILPITEEIADRWGRINAEKTLPVVDGLIAATALENNLTVVTRNLADFDSVAPTVNPWGFRGSGL